MKALALTSPKMLALMLSGVVNLALLGAISASSVPHTGPGLRWVQLPSVTVVGKRLPRDFESTKVAQAPKTVPSPTSAKMYAHELIPASMPTSDCGLGHLQPQRLCRCTARRDKSSAGHTQSASSSTGGESQLSPHVSAGRDHASSLVPIFLNSGLCMFRLQIHHSATTCAPDDCLNHPVQLIITCLNIKAIPCQGSGCPYRDTA